MSQQPVSDKSRTIALILVLLLGYLGIHRFYVDKIWSGILYLCTYGLFGIGVLVDLILILSGSFTDSKGNYVLNWDEKAAPITTTTPSQKPSVQTTPITPSEVSQETASKGTVFCSNCGAAIDAGESFCKYCGNPLEKS